jgi:hypothetical protein
LLLIANITHPVPDFIGATPLFSKRGGWGVSV